MSGSTNETVLMEKTFLLCVERIILKARTEAQLGTLMEGMAEELDTISKVWERIARWKMDNSFPLSHLYSTESQELAEKIDARLVAALKMFDPAERRPSNED